MFRRLAPLRLRTALVALVLLLGDLGAAVAADRPACPRPPCEGETTAVSSTTLSAARDAEPAGPGDEAAPCGTAAPACAAAPSLPIAPTATPPEDRPDRGSAPERPVLTGIDHPPPFRPPRT